MPQWLTVNKFEWFKDTPQYNEESDEGYFLEVDVQYPEKLHEDENLKR